MTGSAAYAGAVDLSELRDLLARNTRQGRSRIGENAAIAAVHESGSPEFSDVGTVLVLLVQGAKQLALGDTVHTYRPGEFLVASVDLPMSGRFFDLDHERPALGFSMRLRPQLVAELLLERAAADLPSAPHAPPGIAVAPVPADVIEAVTRMVRLLDRPRDLPVLAPLIERELTWLALSGPLGASVRHLGTTDSTLRRVGEAVNRLRDSYADPVRVDELAALARRSPAAFYRNFRAVTSMSPIGFQKHIRLQQARMRILTARQDIAGAAYAVGYESPSQFSRDYRRWFGVSPSEDIHRFEASSDAA